MGVDQNKLAGYEVDDWIGVHDSSVFGNDDHFAYSALWVLSLFGVVFAVIYRYRLATATIQSCRSISCVFSISFKSSCISLYV